MWSDRQVERLMCTVIAVCNRAAQRAIGGSDIYMAKWQAEGGVLTGYFMNDVRGMMAEIGEQPAPAPAAPSQFNEDGSVKPIAQILAEGGDA